MSALIIDGRGLASALRVEIITHTQSFRREFGQTPTLAIVRVGNDPACISYARQVDKMFTDSGMGYQLHILPADANQLDAQDVLLKLGQDPNVHGVLLQRPLPPQIDGDKLMANFPVLKDIEGVSPTNMGMLFQNRGDYFPTSTPNAAMEILRHYRIPIARKQAVIVGRSNILGRPMAMLLLHANATVTICHSHTDELAEHTRRADILIAAAGVPRLIQREMVKPGATVLDFGVNVIHNQVIGDVDFEQVKQVAGIITPVPGGTGPVTTVMLMRNTLNAAIRQTK